MFLIRFCWWDWLMSASHTNPAGLQLLSFQSSFYIWVLVALVVSESTRPLWWRSAKNLFVCPSNAAKTEISFRPLSEVRCGIRQGVWTFWCCLAAQPRHFHRCGWHSFFVSPLHLDAYRAPEHSMFDPFLRAHRCLWAFSVSSFLISMFGWSTSRDHGTLILRCRVPYPSRSPWGPYPRAWRPSILCKVRAWQLQSPQIFQSRYSRRCDNFLVIFPILHIAQCGFL